MQFCLQESVTELLKSLNSFKQILSWPMLLLFQLYLTEVQYYYSVSYLLILIHLNMHSWLCEFWLQYYFNDIATYVTRPGKTGLIYT